MGHPQPEDSGVLPQAELGWGTRRVRSSERSHAPRCFACTTLEGVTILENVPLAQYTTLGVGGAARWFVDAKTDDQMLEAVRFARAGNVAYFIVGGGSNLLVS